MARSFSVSEKTVIAQAMANNGGKGQRTVARELVSSGKLPDRSFYAIYSNIREHGSKRVGVAVAEVVGSEPGNLDLGSNA